MTIIIRFGVKHCFRAHEAVFVLSRACHNKKRRLYAAPVSYATVFEIRLQYVNNRRTQSNDTLDLRDGK